MKNKLLLKCLLIFLVTGLNFMRAQTIDSNAVTNSLGHVSPDGIMDAVFDQYGNKYSLDDIRAGASYKNSNGVLQPSVVMCSPGYFNLFFEVGSGMDGTSTTEINRRNLICQVFTDISNFINSPLSTAGNTNRVNIWVRDVDILLPGYNPNTNPNPSATSGVLGLATAFYNVPQNNTTGFGGIADNEIWKTIHTGADSYINVASPLSTQGGINSSGGTFYHGMMAFNFNNSTINWNTDLSIASPSTLYDLYSVALHEVTHALGFASLIGANGLSKFGTGYNYYSRYDRFLRNSSNTQSLITNAGSCSLYNYQFNTALTATTIAPGGACTPDATACATAARYVSSNTNVPVYTPNCFEAPSSLSHFEDECFPTAAAPHGNNLYFVMSNANGTGATFTKRHLQPEERRVLCDLGYNTNAVFGTGTNQFDYTVATCAGMNIGGINDGINGWGAYAYTGNAGDTIPINGILVNDRNANSFECLQDVYDGTATLSTTTGTFTTIINFSSNVTGTHLLRYIPVSPTGQRGNITYIYVYVNNANCIASACNIINNGGFENNTNCGQMPGTTPVPTINCWTTLSASPDLYVRGCIPTGANNITVPTTRCTPASDTWNNGANNNDAMLGMWSTQGAWNEAIQTPLSGGIQPNTSYVLSFWAKIQNSSGLSQNISTTLVFGGSSGNLANFSGWYSATPGGLTTLATVVIPANNQWNQYTITLNNTASTLNFLTIINAAYLNTTHPAGHSTCVMIDDVSIQPVSQATSLTLPNTLCINQTISDLGSYLSPAPAGGQFTGAGVTFTNGVFSFDATTASVGNHIITYSYTNNLGCDFSVSDIVTVVNSNLNVTATATPNAICSTQPVTFTADGANTYVWQPGNLPGSSITVNLTGTTSYTVTGTDVNGCIGQAISTVMLASLPTVTVTPTNPTVCYGQSTALTASGASTYSWAPSTGLNTTSGATVTASPTTTTTYTITSTNASGCIGQTTTTVVVLPLPTVTTNPVNPTVCYGESVILTASGANSYSWIPSTGLNTTSGATVVASPAGNTTYTVTGTTGGGCIGQNTVTLTFQECPCNDCPFDALPGSLTVDPIPDRVYCVKNDITVNANVNIRHCELKISPNVTITIAPGKTLTISGSHLYGCSDMWKGIVVSSGARVKIVNYNTGTVVVSSLIEDAIVAIDVASNNTLASDIVVANNVTFNRNQISIRVKDYAQQITNYPFTIVNSVFTCRDLPFIINALSWPLTNNIKMANNPVTSPLQTPYINNASYSASAATAFLKVPFAGQKPQIGIHINRVGSTINPASTPTYYEMLVGTTGANNYNVFDNHIVSLYAQNSNVKVTNSVFQNTIATGLLGNVDGIGIKALSENPYNNRLQVMGATTSGMFANKFFNCHRAISSQNYFEHYIRYNDIRSTQSNQAPVIPLGQPGKYGIQINTNRFREITVSSNKLYNIESGITFDGTLGLFNVGASNGNGQYSGQLTVIGNIIQQQVTGAAITNQYIANAISIRNIIAPGQNVLVPGKNVNVSSNRIDGAFRGIYIANWLAKDVVTNGNNVKLIFDGNFGNPIQYGINYSNNGPVTRNIVQANTITGYNTTNPKLYGIYTSLSSYQTVTCNTVTTTYHGLAFNGNCTPIETNYNSLSNHRYGFVLDNNGLIGTQGTATAPCDNSYNGTWVSPNFKTATLNGSSAQNSPMYVRATGNNANPNGSGTAVFPSIIGFDEYSQSLGSLIYVSGNPTFIGCNTNPANSNGNNGNANNGNNGGGNDPKIILEKIVQDQITTTKHPVETGKINKHLVYRLLKTNPNLMDGSVVLQDFYTESQATIREQSMAVETDLSQGEIVSGANKVAFITPQDNIESNYKSFYESLIKQATDSLSGNDSISLVSIANGCPFTDGAVVYQARAFYNSVYSTNVVFEDNCLESNSASRVKQTKDKNELNDEFFDALVYPNPNSGNVFIAPIGKEIDSMTIIVTDITGKEVFNSELQVKEGFGNFELNVNSGTYFVKIVNAHTNEKIIKRLVIQK